MLHKIGKLLLIPALVAGLLVAVAAPANAATTGATTHQSNPAGISGGGGVMHPDWDWGDVIRVLGSMVECNALIPIYEVIYFPSAIACFPYDGGAVMVIVELW